MKYSCMAAVAVVSAALGGCSYQVATMSAPNLNVYSNYTNKIPGRWILTIDAFGASQAVKPEGLLCSAHNYPLDLTSSFRSSVAQTFQNLAESVDVQDTAPPASTVAAQGYKGVIHVKLESLRPRLQFIEGFFTGTAQADVEVDAGLLVDGPSGRLLGTQASGHGRSETNGGCPDGASVLGHASEDAMKSLLGELGERFGNAPQLRGVPTR